jgi:hypothetical protein
VTTTKDVKPRVAWKTGTHDGVSAHESDEPGRLGLKVLGPLAALALLGAAWLGLSLARSAGTSPGFGAWPRTVLVAVQGNAAEPGFAGFLAHISPNSRIVTVTPVSGTLPGPAPTDPLWSQAASMTAAQLAGTVAHDSGRVVSGYFVIQVATLQQMLTALSDYVPDWPKRLTPAATLRVIGWGQKASPHRALYAMEAIIQGLPALEDSQNALQKSVLSASATNLSAYQMFMLATYIRGGTLRMVPWPRRGRR